MSNITSYPLEDSFKTSLTQSWDGSTGDINVATTPNFTFPSGVTTYLVVNPGKTNMQIAEINAYNATNKTITVSNITLEKGASVNSTAQTHVVGSEVIISDNFQFWSDIITAVNTKLDQDGGNTTTTWDLQVSGSNFRIRKDGNDMKFTDDNNAEVSLSTLAAAAGADTKVGISVADTTPSQLENKLTAGDGLSITKINPGGNESLDMDIDLTDITIFSDAGVADRAAITDSSGNLFQATTSARGGVEMATDAEASTGTDETRYINPKQLKDNGLASAFSNAQQLNSATVGTTTTIAHGLGKTPKLVKISSGTDTAITAGVSSEGAYDGTNQACIYRVASASTSSTAFSVYVYQGTGEFISGVISVDSTNITITWTRTGTANYNFDILTTAI